MNFSVPAAFPISVHKQCRLYLRLRRGGCAAASPCQRSDSCRHRRWRPAGPGDRGPRLGSSLAAYHRRKNKIKIYSFINSNFFTKRTNKYNIFWSLKQIENKPAPTKKWRLRNIAGSLTLLYFRWYRYVYLCAI